MRSVTSAILILLGNWVCLLRCQLFPRSALLGDFTLPVAEDVAAPAKAATRTPRTPNTNLSEDDRESLAKSIFSDFLASRRADNDLEEASGASEELAVPGFMPKLLTIGLEKAFGAYACASGMTPFLSRLCGGCRR